MVMPSVWAILDVATRPIFDRMFVSEEARIEDCHDNSAELPSYKQISDSIESAKIGRSRHLAIYGVLNSVAGRR